MRLIGKILVGQSLCRPFRLCFLDYIFSCTAWCVWHHTIWHVKSTITNGKQGHGRFRASELYFFFFTFLNNFNFPIYRQQEFIDLPLKLFRGFYSILPKSYLLGGKKKERKFKNVRCLRMWWSSNLQTIF